MKKALFSAFFALLFCVAGEAFADPNVYPASPTWKQYSWSWVSTSGGTYEASPVIDVTGTIEGAIFEPSGVSQPSVGYDVVVKDSRGNDVLINTGLNCINVSGVSNYRTPLTLDLDKVVLFREPLTLSVSNAGEASAGKVFLIVK